MRYLVLGILAGAIISLAFIAGHRQGIKDDCCKDGDCCKPGQPKSILVKSGDGKRSLSIWSSEDSVGLSVGPIGGPFAQIVSQPKTSYLGLTSPDATSPEIALSVSDRGERTVQLADSTGAYTISVPELVKILKTLRASPRKRPDGRIGDDGNPNLPPS